MSVEARELQLEALAMDEAERQLREGTASSQVITHFLKLGSTRERLEKEKLQLENELVKAKTESLKAQEHADELFANAIKAMKRYSGTVFDDDDTEEEPDD